MERYVVVVRGTDMVVCELCFVLLREGRDRFWPQIPLNGGTPIYLPITHPEWGSPHAQSPDDQAEAESRLPAGLLADKRDEYARGFRDTLYDLVGTEPQRLHRLRHADQRSAATLDWPGISLMRMLSLFQTSHACSAFTGTTTHRRETRSTTIAWSRTTAPCPTRADACASARWQSAPALALESCTTD